MNQWILEPDEILTVHPILPVLVVDSVEQAVSIGNALIEGGYSALEVTLRTPAALDAITEMRRTFPDVLVGAGTVLNTADYDQAVKAGAQFAVSPGLTEALLRHARNQTIPFIPGVASASEIMQALAHGYECLKFFPAEASGGVAVLKAFGGPFPQVRFCPSGGIIAANAQDYLALPNVAAVSGSWMVSDAVI
ncbi:bifunctional 4-hydroxy-2-oxoglutarate aldolase/2-dehydro-3-deoxy-phosphogluconate aldolase [Kistimonas asteriae]|uniref:bifunctional 4-hydroxy-2-oxoglutarate aldolase/2-dehydro-3-deoxy-phosphogluconate aldolase n=1 Tax=Kistimonas asteriae TaxID=517724 RepID=UPI001BA7FB89|nr:bifunctional 4-hydroxy-2-oxoglutarate aldolase/2-dehydro-3-deoxy-phosphogluconate aldolase [Kistimonas asteriae]